MQKVILTLLLFLTTAAVQSQSETTVYNSSVEVSIESPKISFKDLCAFLSKTTAIDVAVDARCADQSFTLFLHNRKASDVFAALEAIVPGKWEQKPNSMAFLFVPDRAHMTEKQRWWKAYNIERDNVLQQQKQLLLQQMARKPATNRVIESITDKNMREAVRNGAISHAFWPSLDTPQQNKIADIFDNLDSYGKGNSFSPRGEGGTFLPWSEISVASKNAAFRAAVQHGQNIADTKFTGVLFIPYAQSINAALVRDDGRQIEFGASVSLPFYAVPPTFRLDHRHLSASIAQLVKMPISTNGRAMRKQTIPRGWLRFAADQEKQFWPGEYGEKASDVVPKRSMDDGVPERWVDVARHAAKAYQFDYISDYYSLPYKPMEQKILDTKNVPLEAHLNKISTEQDRSWKKPGEIVLFRHNRWYRDDFLEAPSEKVSAFVEKHKPLFGSESAKLRDAKSIQKYLDACTELVQNYSLWQIANGLHYYVQEDALEAADAALQGDYQPLAGLTEAVLKHYRLLSFYATLMLEQKNAIVTEGLTSSELNITQARQLAETAPAHAALLESSTLVKIILENPLFRMMSGDVFSSASGGASRYKLRLSFAQRQ